MLAAGCGESPEETSVVQEIDIRTLVVTNSIGIEFGDSCYVLGAIEGVAHGSDGSIMILDSSVVLLASCANLMTFSGMGRKTLQPQTLILSRQEPSTAKRRSLLLISSVS